MKISHNQLRRIIKEEYQRVTPVQPGQVMSEARAMYLAEEVMAEGFLGNLWAGLKGAGSETGKKAGAAAGAAKDAVVQKATAAGKEISAAAQKIVAPIATAGKEAAKAIGDIKDAGVRAAAENAAAELKATLGPMIKQQVAQLIKSEVKSGKDEASAKVEAEAIVMNALAAALLGIGT
jgi:hypothetical protein